MTGSVWSFFHHVLWNQAIEKLIECFSTATKCSEFIVLELGDPSQQPVGINLMQLTIAPDELMAEQAKQLIERVELEETGKLAKNEIIEVITTIAVYKFSSLSREEVEAMLGLSIEETRIYQDLERQTKLKAAERLLGMGYSISEVAKAVDLSVEEVTKIASNPSE